MTAIKRIGVIVKPHQPDALETLCRLTEWLNERHIKLVGGPDLEHERIEHETGCAVESVEPAELSRGRLDRFHAHRIDGLQSFGRRPGDLSFDECDCNHAYLSVHAVEPADRGTR